MKLLTNAMLFMATHASCSTRQPKRRSINDEIYEDEYNQNLASAAIKIPQTESLFSSALKEVWKLPWDKESLSSKTETDPIDPPDSPLIDSSGHMNSHAVDALLTNAPKVQSILKIADESRTRLAKTQKKKVQLNMSNPQLLFSSTKDSFSGIDRDSVDMNTNVELKEPVKVWTCEQVKKWFSTLPQGCQNGIGLVDQYKIDGADLLNLIQEEKLEAAFGDDKLGEFKMTVLGIRCILEDIEKRTENKSIFSKLKSKNTAGNLNKAKAVGSAVVKVGSATVKVVKFINEMNQ